jgi:hypothetical protein
LGGDGNDKDVEHDLKNVPYPLPLLSFSASYSTRWAACPPYAPSHLRPIAMEPANQNLWNNELELLSPPLVDETSGMSHGAKSLINRVGGGCLFLVIKTKKKRYIIKIGRLNQRKYIVDFLFYYIYISNYAKFSLKRDY